MMMTTTAAAMTTSTTPQQQHHHHHQQQQQQQQSIFARLSATIGHHSQSEQKLARMRAAYSSANEGGTASASASAKIQKAGLKLASDTSNSLPSLPNERNSAGTGDTNNDSSSRRASAVANCLPSPSIMELAKSAGLLSLNPSDLVFESSVLGIAYYDFVLSVSEVEYEPAPSAAGAEHEQQKNEKSPNKKALAKRRVHETGSAPLNGTPTIGGAGANVAPIQRKRGQTMEKEKGAGRSLVAMLQKQRTEMQLVNNKSNNTKQSSLLPSFEKGSMSEIQEKCEIEEAEKHSTNTTRTPSKSPSTERKNNNKNNNTLYRIFLAKFDAHTNVQWFESVLVPRELLERNGIPVSELSLLTMGILVWRCTLNNARLLCLVNGMQKEQMHEDGNSTAASFEALKRAASKYKCMHHVLTIGQRRPSVASTHSSCSSSSRRSSSASVTRSQTQQETGMRLRILMCQSRCELPEVPPQAIRETKFLLCPSSNPLLCLCFPLT
ncbi:hypothetical protein niasHT_012099 [Heterodera trifolii]|uniref:Uncharacterized protein n=1 Tax=Heterodera trifolii TaxID=157864 RepID=A0ABD2LA76_9BILA